MAERLADEIVKFCNGMSGFNEFNNMLQTNVLAFYPISPMAEYLLLAILQADLSSEGVLRCFA